MKEMQEMIKEMDNVKPLELFETDTKTQCKMSVVLESWHRLLHLRASLERK